MIEFLIGAALAAGKAYDVPGRSRAYAAAKKKDLVAKSKATARKIPTAAKNKAGRWYTTVGEKLVSKAERFQVWADLSSHGAVQRYKAKKAGMPPAPDPKPRSSRATPTPRPPTATAAKPAKPTGPATPAGPGRATPGGTGLTPGSLPYPNYDPYFSPKQPPAANLPTPRPTPPAPVQYQRNVMEYAPANRQQAFDDVNNYGELKARLDQFRDSAFDDLEMAQQDLARANAWAAHLDTLANSLKDRGFDDATIGELLMLAEHAKAEAAAQMGVAAAAAGTFAAAHTAQINVTTRWDQVAAFVAELQRMPDISFFQS